MSLEKTIAEKINQKKDIQIQMKSAIDQVVAGINRELGNLNKRGTIKVYKSGEFDQTMWTIVSEDDGYQYPIAELSYPAILAERDYQEEETAGIENAIRRMIESQQ